jgi:hypothetical protein
MVDSQRQTERQRSVLLAILLVACAFGLFIDPFEFLLELPWLIADLRKGLSGWST